MTNKETDIKPYFETLPGEVGPRIEIKREGVSLKYSDLEKMTVKDLISCQVNLLGERVISKKEDSITALSKYAKYNLGITVIRASTYFSEEEKASLAVISCYNLVTARLSGAI